MAQVRVRVGVDRVVGLRPGDLVGRGWLAALHIDDPRVSEAHALVSLRGDRLRLLPLRGRFTVDGRRVDEADLAIGQYIEVAPGVGFVVIDLEVPSSIVALQGDGLAPTALHGAAGVAFRPEPAIVHPAAAEARVWLWEAATGWRVRHSDGSEQPLAMGVDFEVGARRFRLVETATRSTEPTSERAERVPLRLVARYETVHLFRQRAPVLIIDGLSARLISELVAFAVPVPWLVLAEALWGAGIDGQRIRKRLDNVLGRLRESLREGGVRDDLVRANGLGQIELLLESDDCVEAQL